MDLDELSWFLERKLQKLTILLSDDNRPSSEPFLSGDSFRKLAQHIYENPKPRIRVQDIRDGDIIFVECDLIDTFFDSIHPDISNKYILITHNGEKNIDDTYLSKIDDKIIHWFTQNLLIEHPKLSPLPKGLENARFANIGMKSLYQLHSSDIAAIKEGNVEQIRDMRKSRILYSFNADANPSVRGDVLAALKDCDTADKLNRGDFVSQPTYIEVLRSYMYVISPAGKSEDCYRTWESLYTGTLPIVAENKMTLQFQKLGVPLFVIHDWKQLSEMSKYELIAKYDLIWQGANIDTLYFDFWKDMIIKKQRLSL